MQITGWPSLDGVPQDKIWPDIEKYKSTWHYIPELLVVGALDPATGKRWSMSGISSGGDGWFPELYAPGDQLTAANGDKTMWPIPENKYPLPKPKPDEFVKKLNYYKENVGTSDGELHALWTLEWGCTLRAQSPVSARFYRASC